jgi:flagellin
LGSAATSFVLNTHVSTASLAAIAIDALDAAIQVVNSQRAALGSYSNRLDHTVTNLTNVSTNLQAGLGRIEDADFAAETTNLAKTQILQQASTAMLAQANASKQNVLSLLQG